MMLINILVSSMMKMSFSICLRNHKVDLIVISVNKLRRDYLLNALMTPEYKGPRQRMYSGVLITLAWMSQSPDYSACPRTKPSFAAVHAAGRVKIICC